MLRFLAFTSYPDMNDSLKDWSCEACMPLGVLLVVVPRLRSGEECNK